MTVSFSLPTPKAKQTPAVPTLDARRQLERLYREIGVAAVASALRMHGFTAIDEQERAGLRRHDVPAMVRDDDLAA